MQTEKFCADRMPTVVERIRIKTEAGGIPLRYIQGRGRTGAQLTLSLSERPHMRDCLTLLSDGAGDRVILLCDTMAGGLSAAGFLADALLLQKRQEKDPPWERKERFFGEFDTGVFEIDESEEGDADGYFTDGGLLEGQLLTGMRAAVTGGCCGEGDMESILREDRFVLFSERELDGGSCDDAGDVQGPVQLSMRPRLEPDAAAAIIVLCDGMTALSEQTAEFLLGWKKPVLIVLPREKANKAQIDRLLFEGGFVLAGTEEPSCAFLAGLLSDLVAEQGCHIAEEVDREAVIQDLKKARRQLFCENDVARLAALAVRRAQTGGNGFQNRVVRDFSVEHYEGDQRGGAQLFADIVGLERVKKIVETEANRLAYRKKMAEREKDRGAARGGYETEQPAGSMAFVGRPGTCKTTMARAMAVRLAELGVTNGVFLEAGREDLVGRYMGETSHKVAAMFRKARGGVLFIDEAGSLIGGDRDQYGVEALSAVVRHMENERETVVIFATYGGEMEKLFSANEGLRSRIARVVEFPDYSVEELIGIFRGMAGRRGYRLGEDCLQVLELYFRRAAKKKDFGGGREARRLLETAEGVLANSVVAGWNGGTEAFDSESPGAEMDLLTGEILRKAAGELLREQSGKGGVQIIGFQPCGAAGV